MSWRLSQSSNNSDGIRQSVSFTNRNLTSIPDFWANNPKVEKANFSNNPKITSIEKIPMLKYLRVLNLDNTSIASLKGANELPNLEEITFVGTPFANNTFCNLMCLSIYPKLKSVNNIEFSKKEIAFVEKNKATISKFTSEGYILMSIGNSRRKSDLGKSNDQNSQHIITTQEGETSLKFINPETRKRKTFYENIRLSFRGQESIKFIPSLINSPEYANLEVLILSGTGIKDLFGLPTLHKLRDLQLNDSQFTTLNNCLSEQPKLESISYNNTPFKKCLEYNQEMSLIVFPTLKNINKETIPDDIVQNVNNILSKDLLSKDKIVRRGLVIADIKSGPKFLPFDQDAKVILDPDKNSRSVKLPSKVMREASFDDLSNNNEPDEYDQDYDIEIESYARKNDSKQFNKFLSDGEEEETHETQKRPKARSQIATSKKNKPVINNSSDDEIIDDIEQNYNKRPKAESQVPKSRTQKKATKPILRNKSKKSNKKNNDPDENQTNNNEEEEEEYDQINNTQPRPKAQSQASYPRKRSGKNLINDDEYDKILSENEEEEKDTIQKNQSSKKGSLKYSQKNKNILSDDEENEFGYKKRPKAQSQVANSKKGNLNHKQSTKKSTKKNVLSDSEDEDLGSQKRPKAQSQVANSKKDNIKRNQQTKKSTKKDEEDFHNIISDNEEEEPNSTQKRPKAQSQVANSKKGSIKRNQPTKRSSQKDLIDKEEEEDEQDLGYQKRPKAQSQVANSKKGNSNLNQQNKKSSKKEEKLDNILSDDGEEEIQELGYQKRPKAQSQVSNSIKGNSKRNQPSKKSTQNDKNNFDEALSDDEEEDNEQEPNPTQKRPKAQSQVANTKKGSTKQNQQNKKSTKKGNEKLDNILSDDGEEEIQELGYQKRPKAQSQIANTKKGSTKRNQQTKKSTKKGNEKFDDVILSDSEEEDNEPEPNSTQKRPKAQSQVANTKKGSTKQNQQTKKSSKKGEEKLDNILSDDGEEEIQELGYQKRPKAQSQVANTKKGSTKQNQQTKKSTKKGESKYDDNILSDSEEEEDNEQEPNPTQKRPKARSQLSNTKKESKGSNKNHKNDYSDELENQTNQKRPKAGSQIPSSKRKQDHNYDNGFDYSRSNSEEDDFENKVQPILKKNEKTKTKTKTNKNEQEDERENFDSFSESGDSENNEKVLSLSSSKEKPKKKLEQQEESNAKKGFILSNKREENFDSISSDDVDLNIKHQIENRKNQRKLSSKENIKNKKNEVKMNYDIPSNEETDETGYSTQLDDDNENKNKPKKQIKNQNLDNEFANSDNENENEEDDDAEWSATIEVEKKKPKQPTIPKFVSSDEPDEDYGSA